MEAVIFALGVVCVVALVARLASRVPTHRDEIDAESRAAYWQARALAAEEMVNRIAEYIETECSKYEGP